MRCLSPIHLNATKSHPAMDVPCGKCVACLTNRRNEWQIRMIYHTRQFPCCFFVTLTYSDDALPVFSLDQYRIWYDHIGYRVDPKISDVIKSKIGKPCFSVQDVQKFIKRLRKSLKKVSLSYFCTAEYGEVLHRPHYHLIIWLDSHLDWSTFKDFVAKSWSPCCESFGRVSVEAPRSLSAVSSYCCKYLLSLAADDYTNFPKQIRPFNLCSRRPAIGFGALNSDLYEYFEASKDNKSYPALSSDLRRYPFPRAFRRKFTADGSSELDLFVQRQKEDADSYFSKFGQYDLTHNETYHSLLKRQKTDIFLSRVKKLNKI